MKKKTKSTKNFKISTDAARGFFAMIFGIALMLLVGVVGGMEMNTISMTAGMIFGLLLLTTMMVALAGAAFIDCVETELRRQQREKRKAHIQQVQQKKQRYNFDLAKMNQLNQDQRKSS